MLGPEQEGGRHWGHQGPRRCVYVCVKQRGGLSVTRWATARVAMKTSDGKAHQRRCITGVWLTQWSQGCTRVSECVSMSVWVWVWVWLGVGVGVDVAVAGWVGGGWGRWV